jgi:3-deoxy-D-manno-octulosonate 8-phosphate phosphatase (KDO 8-P phosphatase)
MEEITIKEKASRIRMLVLDVDGTLTDGGVYIDVNGVQSRKFNIRDGMGITLLQEAGIPVGLLSHSNIQGILEERARMLNVQYVYSGKESKLHVLHRWMKDLSLRNDEVAYIGDDVNDIEVITGVGLGACPADAHHLVVRSADIVLRNKGGEGCVREFIDRYLLPQQEII